MTRHPAQHPHPDPDPDPDPDPEGSPASADLPVPAGPGNPGGTRPQPDDGLTGARLRKDIERRPRERAAVSATALMERSSW
jgi:hypothetical protein